MKKVWIVAGAVAGGALLWHFWSVGEMKFLPNVQIEGAKPQLWFGLDVAASLLKWLGGPELTVTSMVRPVISAGAGVNSLHPVGQAVDIRNSDIPGGIYQAFVGLLKKILMPLGFDVVPESDHLHLEYDPKSARFLF